MRSPILKQASIATGCIPQGSTCGNQNNEDGTFDETEDWWCKYYKPWKASDGSGQVKALLERGIKD
jgi:hypothetical protein